MYFLAVKINLSKSMGTQSPLPIFSAYTFRLKMYGFWNNESRLSSDTLGRLTQLLAVLYSSNTERQFLFHSTNLLLELTSRSPDYNRSMFDSPLSECKFEVCMSDS